MAKGGASGKGGREKGGRAYLGFTGLVDGHLALCGGGEDSKYISEGAIVATQQRDGDGLKGTGRQKRKEKSAPNLGLRMQGTL